MQKYWQSDNPPHDLCPVWVLRLSVGAGRPLPLEEAGRTQHALPGTLVTGSFVVDILRICCYCLVEAIDRVVELKMKMKTFNI